jgi:hypothetical protein
MRSSTQIDTYSQVICDSPLLLSTTYSAPTQSPIRNGSSDIIPREARETHIKPELSAFTLFTPRPSQRSKLSTASLHPTKIESKPTLRREPSKISLRSPKILSQKASLADSIRTLFHFPRHTGTPATASTESIRPGEVSVEQLPPDPIPATATAPSATSAAKENTVATASSEVSKSTASQEASSGGKAQGQVSPPTGSKFSEGSEMVRVVSQPQEAHSYVVTEEEDGISKLRRKASLAWTAFKSKLLLERQKSKVKS